MQVTVEVLSPIQRRISVSVPAQEVTAQFEARLAKFAKTVKINGFRPGKVPLSRVRAEYGYALHQEVVNDAVRDKLFKAIEQEKVPVVGVPNVEKVDLTDDTLSFDALVDTYPEVTVPDFSTLSVDRKSTEITDADVDTMVENLRKQRQTFVTKEGVAANGDAVTIDYTGTIDGVEFDGGKAEGYKITLGSGQMIPGFEEGILGLSAGDEKVIDVTFPEDYQAKEVAGKAAKFAIKVQAVETPVLPEVNDEFLAVFGITEGGIDKLKVDVKKNMNREVKNNLRTQNKQAAFNAVVDAAEVELPQAMIAEEIKRQRERFVAQFAQYGGQMPKFDDSMLPDSLFEEQAKRAAKTGVLLGKILENANLQVDPARVDSTIQDIAESYEDPSEVIEYFKTNKGDRANLEAAVLEDQLADLIFAGAKVNDITLSYQDLLQSQPNAG